jgi:hypothetical protein
VVGGGGGDVSQLPFVIATGCRLTRKRRGCGAFKIGFAPEPVRLEEMFTEEEEDSAHQAHAHAVAAYLSWQKRASVCRLVRELSRAAGKHFNFFSSQQLDVCDSRKVSISSLRIRRSIPAIRVVDNEDPVC